MQNSNKVSTIVFIHTKATDPSKHSVDEVSYKFRKNNGSNVKLQPHGGETINLRTFAISLEFMSWCGWPTCLNVVSLAIELPVRPVHCVTTALINWPLNPPPRKVLLALAPANSAKQSR